MAIIYRFSDNLGKLMLTVGTLINIYRKLSKLLKAIVI